MKEKQYDPARHNEESPVEGMAAVNTHNPEEKEIPTTIENQKLNEEVLATKTENDKNKYDNSINAG